MTLSERYQAAKAEMSGEYILLDRHSLKARYAGICAISGKRYDRGDKIVGVERHGWALLWVAQAQLTPDTEPAVAAAIVEMPVEFGADIAAGYRDDARIDRAEMAMEAIG